MGTPDFLPSWTQTQVTWDGGILTWCLKGGQSYRPEPLNLWSLMLTPVVSVRKGLNYRTLNRRTHQRIRELLLENDRPRYFSYGAWHLVQTIAFTANDTLA